MEKLTKPFCLLLALIVLSFAGCASQPQASNNTGSPLQRGNGNGLASYIH